MLRVCAAAACGGFAASWLSGPQSVQALDTTSMSADELKQWVDRPRPPSQQVARQQGFEESEEEREAKHEAHMFGLALRQYAAHLDEGVGDAGTLRERAEALVRRRAGELAASSAAVRELAAAVAPQWSDIPLLLAAADAIAAGSPLATVLPL